MKKIAPDGVAALIFGLVGALFLALGLVFVGVSQEHLPELLDAALWLADDTPDELALPMVGIIFTGMGGLCLLLGLILWLLVRRRARLREELLAWGTRVTGVVAKVVTDRSVQVNRRSPLRIVAEVQHPVTRELVRVRSRQVWSTSLAPGDTVDVLFDPMNEKRRMLDVPQEG